MRSWIFFMVLAAGTSCAAPPASLARPAARDTTGDPIRAAVEDDVSRRAGPTAGSVSAMPAEVATTGSGRGEGVVTPMLGTAYPTYPNNPHAKIQR